MLVRKSRYRPPEHFASPSTFPGIRPRKIDAATGVIEHIVQAGDRPDLLARYYYNDDRLWWRIMDANPDLLHGGSLAEANREGDVILIPKPRE